MTKVSRLGLPFFFFLGLLTSLFAAGGAPTKSSDIYAFGVMMYELLIGAQPYQDLIGDGITAEELRDRVMDGLRPSVPEKNSDGTIGHLKLHVPQALLDLMTEMWSKNPARRPDIKEVEERIQEVCSAHQLARTDVLKQQALLADIFPPKVRKALSEGRKVEPEAFDIVTIFFSDIVGKAPAK